MIQESRSGNRPRDFVTEESRSSGEEEWSWPDRMRTSPIKAVIATRMTKPNEQRRISLLSRDRFGSNAPPAAPLAQFPEKPKEYHLFPSWNPRIVNWRLPTGPRTGNPADQPFQRTLVFGQSRSASLNLLTATARRWSKSTNVSADQRRFLSSSRVTTSPADSRRAVRSRNGCSCSRTFCPSLLSSPARRSTSKVANRTSDGRADGIGRSSQFESLARIRTQCDCGILLQTDDLSGDRQGIVGELRGH